MSKFIIGSDDHAYLDKQAFLAHAREVAQKRAELYRSQEGRNKALSTVNKAISSGLAGVAQLNSIEGDYLTLNIYRDNPALDFMEMRPLPLGTLPIYRTKTTYPVGFQMGSVNGGGSTVYYATKQVGQQVFPFTFTTEKVMLPNLNQIYDLQKLEQRKDALENLDRYLEVAITNIGLNTVLNPNTTGSIVTDDPAASLNSYVSGGGSFSGKTVYSLNPGVPTAAVPTVNFYDLSSTESGLTKKVFQTVNTHSIQIGRNFKTMYIPVQASSGKAPVWESLQNMATPVALVSGQGNQNPASAIPHEMWSEFQKEDFRGSIVIDWFGQRIEVKKQNWMPAGTLLLFSDQPSAILWDRFTLESGQPQDGVLETPADGYYSYRSVSRNLATARPDYCLRNFLVIKVNA